MSTTLSVLRQECKLLLPRSPPLPGDEGVGEDTVLLQEGVAGGRDEVIQGEAQVHTGLGCAAHLKKDSGVSLTGRTDLPTAGGVAVVIELTETRLCAVPETKTVSPGLV